MPDKATIKNLELYEQLKQVVDIISYPHTSVKQWQADRAKISQLQFNKFVTRFGSQPVSIRLDVSGDYPRLEISVWHPKNDIVGYTGHKAITQDIDALSLYCSVNLFAKNARALCCHDRSTVLSYHNCLEKLKCLDCGLIYEVDSSG